MNATGQVINIRRPARLKGAEEAIDAKRKFNDASTWIQSEKLNEGLLTVKLDTHAYSAVDLSDAEFSLDLLSFGEQVMVPQIDSITERLENKVVSAMTAFPEVATTAKIPADLTKAASDEQAGQMIRKALTRLRVQLNKENIPAEGRTVVLGSEAAFNLLERGRTRVTVHTVHTVRVIDDGYGDQRPTPGPSNTYSAWVAPVGDAAVGHEALARHVQDLEHVVRTLTALPRGVVDPQAVRLALQQRVHCRIEVRTLHPLFVRVQVLAEDPADLVSVGPCPLATLHLLGPQRQDVPGRRAPDDLRFPKKQVDESHRSGRLRAMVPLSSQQRGLALWRCKGDPSLWQEEANAFIGPLLGLPGLPYIPWSEPRPDPGGGVFWKTPQIVACEGPPVHWSDALG
ncbi:hypothetical protein ACFVUY_19360 [Kitasatospora sp. NPDC058063]|uniref:hypothetical protein n=1 Tax=unclassified Kitasatospora TaxID=2633591 RepID=UPI0036DF6626